MSDLKTIKLYGDLGEKFGKEFRFAVDSPQHAVKLLGANFKDFAPFFVGDGTKEYHIIVGEQDLELEETGYPVSSKEVIKIIPVVTGSDGAFENPVFRIILGAAILYYSGAFDPAGISALTGWSAVGAQVGISLIIGGVSQILFAPPIPKYGDNEKDENTPNYNFNGPVNTTRQGNPVPVGYGRLRIGSQVISAGFFTTSSSL